jgi:putative glutamine amidotransferase
MSFDLLLHHERPGLERRLRRMVGDPEQAADLTQETLERAWRSAPRGGPVARQRAWLHRTATNVAIDSLRARGRSRTVALEAAHELAAPPHDPTDAEEAEGVREALTRITAHERLVLLLRFDAGLSHREIGALLDLSEEAARKRVARARANFSVAWREVRRATPPLVLLVEGEDRPGPYRRWLERSGARVRVLRRDAIEREVAVADALVFCGSLADVAPETYGERPRAPLRDTVAARDRVDLAVLRLVLREDVPFVGVCRGAQLLNVALGGTLYQDLDLDGISALDHDDEVHDVGAAHGSRLRGLLGGRFAVKSEHHQAVRTLGRGLRAVGHGPDGVVESIELPGRRLALGMQWHPEAPEAGESGAAVAEALLDAAGRTAA